MEKWVMLRKGADFRSIGEKFHISPRLAALIRNRDVIGDRAVHHYLNGSIADLEDGMLMQDMDKAVDILREKVKEHCSIRIIGDYDIDGVCATYVLLTGLKSLGADADSDIPDRMKDGYGLNRDLIDRAFDHDIDTIVTCDNGIAAAEEIAYAKSLGMTVVVTDHHEVPYNEVDGEKTYRLPPADAVVDPKRADCGYPFKGLCGAAVAYKLVEALYEAMGKDADDVDFLMEEVAIATVGDVMELQGENRIFVKQGLEMLKRTKNPGLKALIECTGIDVSRISAYHIGFVLGPCINAGGRLDTAKRALEMLCAETKREADILAGDLKALNDSRKEMTIKAVNEAVQLIETSELNRDRVLVVFLPACHESLAGIVAGRLRERYYKPVFVLTRSETGVKGSGRSIEAYDMFAELNKCAHLLTKFGGHKLAAGVSMAEEDVEQFRTYINEISRLTDDDLAKKVAIDMKLPLNQINEAFITELELLEPFGNGNTKPVFAETNFSVLGGRILGKNKNVLKLRLEDASKTRMEALYFGDIDAFFAYVSKKYPGVTKNDIIQGKSAQARLAFTYYPGVNEYQGQKSLQLVVTNYQ
ncbi:MAG: single-stranded-DNA-specific exonuclease RecJ [Lachnospiraceae bacterium]